MHKKLIGEDQLGLDQQSFPSGDVEPTPQQMTTTESNITASQPLIYVPSKPILPLENKKHLFSNQTGATSGGPRRAHKDDRQQS